ncbi:hypothetical protein Riean_0265 [Riemerella anatipestifer ATCC 11845 = DSM 15868]|nr:hypothetical protein Riean_0265 [Riemerella anatipestifer ATCC 11845 = DSM 15868]EFT35860.1 hypothetical protein RAYM_03137 [Riemerella anatipestifer RA-YM]SNV53563.1 Uncharacterised protein [Riemerella anatipestifer]
MALSFFINFLVKIKKEKNDEIVSNSEILFNLVE